MFGQDRNALRRAWVEAWAAARAGRVLEPLQGQLVAVMEDHAEYHALLDAGESALGDEWTPERGETNPFLHMGLHLALREQVTTDRPIGIRALHRKLARRAGDLHAAEHRMIDCLAEALWRAQADGGAPDERAYLAAIKRLLKR